MSNICEIEFSKIVDIMDNNKQNIKTADYMMLMASLKKIYEIKETKVIVKSKVCSECLSSLSDCHSCSDSDDDYY